jgi:hypothetical protein
MSESKHFKSDLPREYGTGISVTQKQIPSKASASYAKPVSPNVAAKTHTDFRTSDLNGSLDELRCLVTSKKFMCLKLMCDHCMCIFY